MIHLAYSSKCWERTPPVREKQSNAAHDCNVNDLCWNENDHSGSGALQYMQLLHLTHFSALSIPRILIRSAESEWSMSFEAKGAKGEIKWKHLQSGIISHNHQRSLNMIHGQKPLQGEKMGMVSGQYRPPLCAHTHTHTCSIQEVGGGGDMYRKWS